MAHLGRILGSVVGRKAVSYALSQPDQQAKSATSRYPAATLSPGFYSRPGTVPIAIQRASSIGHQRPISSAAVPHPVSVSPPKHKPTHRDAPPPPDPAPGSRGRSTAHRPVAQSTNAGPATSFLDSGLFDTFAIGGSNFGHEPTGTGAILVDHPTRHPSQIPERSASRPRPAWGEQQKPQMQTQAETKAALERRRSESTSRRRYTSAVSPEPTRWASPRKPAVPTQAARVAKHRSPSPTRTTRPHSAPSDRSESRGSMTSMKVRAVSPPMVPPSTRPLTMPSTAITALLSPERILGIPVAALATLIQIPEKIQEAQETSVVTASDIQTLTRELPKLIRLATSAEISYSDEDAPKIRYEEVRDAVLLIKEYTAHLRSPDLSAMLDVEVERLIAHAPLPVAAPPDPLVHSPTRREAIVTAAPARQSNASRITELMAQNLNSPTLEIRKFVSLCQHLNPDEMAQVIDHLRKGTSNEVQISNVLNICVKLSHKSKLDLVEIILTHSAGQRRSVLNSILARKELLPTTNIPQTGIALSTCSILLGALSQSGREGSEAYDSLKTITQGLAYQMGILDSAAITRDTEIAGHASDSGFMNLDTLLANTIPTQTRHQLTQDYQRGLEYGLGLRVDQESRFERESGMRTEQRQLDAFRTDFLTRGTKRAPQLVFRDGESVDSFKARLTSEVRALGNAPNYMAKDDWNQFIQDTVLIINNLLEQETARLTQARASVPSAVPPMSEAAAPPAILSEPPPTAVSRARSEYEIESGILADVHHMIDRELGRRLAAARAHDAESEAQETILRARAQAGAAAADAARLRSTRVQSAIQSALYQIERLGLQQDIDAVLPTHRSGPDPSIMNAVESIRAALDLKEIANHQQNAQIEDLVTKLADTLTKLMTNEHVVRSLADQIEHTMASPTEPDGTDAEPITDQVAQSKGRVEHNLWAQIKEKYNSSDRFHPMIWKFIGNIAQSASHLAYSQKAAKLRKAAYQTVAQKYIADYRRHIEATQANDADIAQLTQEVTALNDYWQSENGTRYLGSLTELDLGDLAAQIQGLPQAINQRIMDLRAQKVAREAKIKEQLRAELMAAARQANVQRQARIKADQAAKLAAIQAVRENVSSLTETTVQVAILMRETSLKLWDKTADAHDYADALAQNRALIHSVVTLVDDARKLWDVVKPSPEKERYLLSAESIARCLTFEGTNPIKGYVFVSMVRSILASLNQVVDTRYATNDNGVIKVAVAKETNRIFTAPDDSAPLHGENYAQKIALYDEQPDYPQPGAETASMVFQCLYGKIQAATEIVPKTPTPVMENEPLEEAEVERTAQQRSEAENTGARRSGDAPAYPQPLHETLLRPRAIAPIVATSPLAAEPRTATHREAVEAIHYASLGLLVPDAHQADFDRELIQLAYHLNIWSRDFDRLSQATKPTRDDEWIQIANDQFIADETGMDRKLIGKIPTIFDAVQDQLTDSDSGQINIPAYLRRARWGESFFDQ